MSQRRHESRTTASYTTLRKLEERTNVCAMTTSVEVVKVRISDVTKDILRTREDERREKDEWIYRFAKIEYLIIKRFIEMSHRVLDHPCRSCPAYNFCMILTGADAEPTTDSSAETMLNCHGKIFEAGIREDIRKQEEEGDVKKWINVANEFRKTYELLEKKTREEES